MKACFCTIAADRDHRAMRCFGVIGDAVIDEILGQLIDPVAGRLFQHRHRLGQHVGVILLALGQESLQHGDADGAAEVAHHVEQGGSRAGILRLRMPAVATAESGAKAKACPSARTTLGQNN